MELEGIRDPAVSRRTRNNDVGTGGLAAAAAVAGTMPPTVNYHLWAACNMRCRFCFAPFQDVIDDVLPRGHLPREESVQLVRVLASRFAKVTFVGGEPTLCPWLPELVRTAKELGATTMLVTNGTRLERVIGELQGVLDWVALSIDSAQ
jgi:radical S-adenosyl methionine domain-containing protein 2